jgi:homoserine dehydrogenase
MGYTEPDPREDLSGQDVARKLLILARLIGLKMDLNEVKVDSLVPKALAGEIHVTIPLSVRTARPGDGRSREAPRRAAPCTLRPLERGRARAGLKEYPRNHPASAKGSDNVIAFTVLYARRSIVRAPAPAPRDGDGGVLGHPEAAALPAALTSC